MKKYKILVEGKMCEMTEHEIENLDTSKITDMSGMFKFAPDFAGDLSNWDVSSVTNMSEMFINCDTFNPRH